jgi:serine O-acetyltransferase
MWSELRADARLYSALRWPGRSSALRRAFIWVRSRGLLILTVQRLLHRYLVRRQQRGWTLETIALRILFVFAPRFIILLAKSDVAASTVIGSGVYLSDGGHLILGPQSIGEGCVIHARVTIGVRAGEEVLPVVCDEVWIGPDSVIYGNVSLGHGATVLPGSVLSMNVAARTVVGGNPAIIVRRDFDNRQLRQTLATDIDRESLTAR